MLLEGVPVRILRRTSQNSRKQERTEGFNEEILRAHRKQSRVFRCATWTTPARLFADKSHAKVSRRTDHRGASATADFERDRRNDEAGPT